MPIVGRMGRKYIAEYLAPHGKFFFAQGKLRLTILYEYHLADF